MPEFTRPRQQFGPINHQAGAPSATKQPGQSSTKPLTAEASNQSPIKELL
jgi:hypothetical protein